jgi:S1-C subfamily serine protease
MAVAGLIGVAVVTAVWRSDTGKGGKLAAGGATWAPVDVSRSGRMVTSLRTGGPAAQAGLWVGDVIDAVDGRAAPDPDALLHGIRHPFARLHVAARGAVGAHRLTLRHGEVASREDPDCRGR